MVISIDTQKEMYEYILSGKILRDSYIDSNFQIFITEQIKYLSKKLYLRTELYIGKMQLELDENNKLRRKKNYKCNSNKLIFDILHQLENCNDFTTEDIKKQLSKLDSVDYRDVIESGSKDRKRLVKLCKLYLQNKEIKLKTEAKSSEEYELEKECFLAETALGMYSTDELDLNIETYVQKSFSSGKKFAQHIKPDIVFIGKDKALVIDIKVYTNVETKHYDTRSYISNNNRFQLNTYIGKVKKQLCKEGTEVYGIILHIINKDVWNRSNDMQGADLTIEDDRPIRLFMIQDKGLPYILSEYDKIVKDYFNN